MNLKVAGPTFEQIMWECAWENACPREWGCRKKAQDLAQPYKTNGSTNGFENTDIASFNVKFYKCEKRIGWSDSGVEKLAAQNVASQGPVHDCNAKWGVWCFTTASLSWIGLSGPLASVVGSLVRVCRCRVALGRLANREMADYLAKARVADYIAG